MPPPLAGGALALAAIALALGTFMQVLDSTIANVSLPTIAGNLGESTDTGTWVITSFAVANGIALPLTGWLMGRYGVVRTFVVSVALFTVASLLCGLAWNLSSLIFFRILQGAVSGPMIPGSQTLLIAIFAPQKRSLALGIWSMTTLVAPVMGPILGGYIADNYHWAWIFLINVPVGIFSVLVSWRFLKDRETPTRKLPIDKVGVLLLAFWVGSLQIVLDLGKNAGWFDDGLIVMFALFALIGFAAWVIWELTERHPVVDLSLFRNRNFTLGTIAFSLGYALFFANTLLLPLWLQTQLGYTATWAGLVAAPSGVVAVILTPFVAKISGKVDVRWLATIAFLAFATSFFMRGRLTADAAFVDFVLPMVVQGIAMSTYFLAMINISLDGIPPERVPSATGISNFARITAGSFAASLVTTMWDRRETLHQARLSEAATADNPAYRMATEQLHGFGLDTFQTAALATRQMIGQSYLLASIDLFTACGWLSLAMIALVWMARRPKPQTGPVAID
ncbi:DHA2 family efflux MFS transporter permease subunit [Sphingomonas solaris]|uniref:DHA2 family efflux MFS transporter permease subunit n=1 Tax=Alterirhizorhabdus solaris TaxID=2529389 RepID=A0A558QSS6_9SPHN|nr:DHA2 family efflux MFS transporter permease subunit [Sphingomonas solaris]TVV70122.1 DHA2 family efflux MFS transporter permease subunit [Sphingomonas solaris]